MKRLFLIVFLILPIGCVSKVEPKAQPAPKAEPKTQPAPKAEPKTQPVVKVEPASRPKAQAQPQFRRILAKDYVDKMKGGWIGQMAGVGWGAPTEFRWKGQIGPEEAMPKWQPKTVNQFNQDDIYVEMTFLRTLELYGLDVSIRQAGIDFANSGYPLWHANDAGRKNLRRGIAPPDSGHPQFNKHADDIDYQIEADYSGLIAPGLPNLAVELGEKFGRLMNYGDGVYGGQFIGAMYAEAFFESDPVKIVQAGLRCVPKGSHFHTCISDVLAWYAQEPADWEKTWQKIEKKYNLDPAWRRFSCSKGSFNIDAKINSAYIVLGLLYGQGDLDKTITIACRSGQDSDCNPSSAGGVIFTTVGFAKLPERFTSALDEKPKFSHTEYNFPTLIEVCRKLAVQAVTRCGGRIEKDDAGQEVFVIPVQEPRPPKLEQCWEAGPPADSKFTPEEMAQIKMSAGDIAAAIKKFAPGWEVKNCGEDMQPGLKGEFRGRKNVLLTHPLNRTTPCVLTRKAEIPADGKCVLKLAVSHHEKGDWDLIVKADGKELLRKTIGKETVNEKGWAEIEVDLSAFAGKTVKLELLNQPTGWALEGGYWGKVEIGK